MKEIIILTGEKIDLFRLSYLYTAKERKVCVQTWVDFDTSKHLYCFRQDLLHKEKLTQYIKEVVDGNDKVIFLTQQLDVIDEILYLYMDKKLIEVESNDPNRLTEMDYDNDSIKEKDGYSIKFFRVSHDETEEFPAEMIFSLRYKLGSDVR